MPVSKSQGRPDDTNNLCKYQHMACTCINMQEQPITIYHFKEQRLSIFLLYLVHFKYNFIMGIQNENVL